jgi:hypothetical protein
MEIRRSNGIHLPFDCLRNFGRISSSNLLLREVPIH